MKKCGLIFGSIFTLGLLAVIAMKLSEDAIAVIIGVGLGVLASVPTSLVIAYILSRQQNVGKWGNQPSGLPQAQHPPVVIVNGGQHQPGLSAGQANQPFYQVPTSQRTFTVVGEETTEV